MRLPEVDPVFFCQRDPATVAIGHALCDGAAIVLDFQHPGCAPDSVAIWIEGLENAEYGPLWRCRFASAPQGHVPGFVYWPGLLCYIGQLSYRDGWLITDRQQEAA